MTTSYPIKRGVLVLAVCIVSATCKQPTTPETQSEKPELTVASITPGVPLGGDLFKFDTTSMKPFKCESCPEPRFRKPDDEPEPEPEAETDGPGLGLSGSMTIGFGGAQEATDRTGSPYFLVKSKDPSTDRLPLKSTRADVAIAGSVAEVRVTQTYANEGKSTIEAIYTFPASSRAAVHALRMTIGERTIEAVIKERAEARKEYEEAKAEGKTASLLEQQRPNVFTMNVANILPGDVIVVEMIYNEMLVPEDGLIEFVYPTVTGPRYYKEAKDISGEEGWVTTEYKKAGEKPDYTFGLDAYINAPMEISCISSHTHEIETLKGEGNEALVTLAESTDTGNRDFVLRYSLASSEIESGALFYEGEDENFFMLMANPPATVPDEQIIAREYIFVVDVSGSMNGFPLDVSKTLMKDLLSTLRKGDYFNLVFFASTPALLAEKSIPATGANVDKAFEKMNQQKSWGGTELTTALKTALALPKVGDAHRVVVVVTDGYISADRECIKTIRENIDQASMFTFGIGSSVNRHLIDGLAHAGKGAPLVVTSQAEAKLQSQRFRAYIDSPVMRDIKVTYEGFDAYDTEPSHIPVLFAGRPIMVLGKYRGLAEGKIVITGQTPGGEYREELDVAQIASSVPSEALRYLWAREAIRNLDDLTGNTSAESGEGKAVLALGLKYSLLTQFTSFVAVDSLVRAEGDPEKVDQPLPLPEGVAQTALPSGIGLGNLNAIGHGGGGGTGIGYGRGAGGLRGQGGGPTSKVKPGAAVVTGSLPKEVIRRIIRQHINEVRFCYEQQLAKHPALAGKIVVEFTIDSTGAVISAKIKSTTLGNSTIEKCIVKAVKRWMFPQPEGGGVVKVTYPFEFKPS